MKRRVLTSVFVAARYIDEGHLVGAARTRALSVYLKDRGVTVLRKGGTARPVEKCPARIEWLVINITAIIKMPRDTLVYISCGPFYYLLPLVAVCRIVGKKYIVDFRDPWSPNIARGYSEKDVKIGLSGSIKLAASRMIEKLAYSGCLAFIVCTPGMKKAYKTLFRDARKIHMFPNGFQFGENMMKFRETAYQPIKGKKTFICLGKFAEYNSAESDKAGRVLRIIAEERDRQGLAVELVFVGSDPEVNGPLLQRFDLLPNAKFLSWMPYEEALRLAAVCDAAILVVRNENIEFGTKIFDYIGLGLPVVDAFDHDKEFYQYFKDVLDAGFGSSEMERSKYSRERFHEAFYNLFISA